MFRIYDELNGDVQENLSGIRVVKSFVREDYEGKKFGKISEKIYKVFRKAESIVAWNMPLMQFAIYACMLLISWFGARMIVLSGATELTTGELSSMIAYAMSALNSLMMLSMVLVMINMARASSERIMELLDEEPTLKNPDAPVMTVKAGRSSLIMWDSAIREIARRNVCMIFLCASPQGLPLASSVPPAAANLRWCR